MCSCAGISMMTGRHVQERYPSVSGFTSIADNCFQVQKALKDTPKARIWQATIATMQRCT